MPAHIYSAIFILIVFVVMSLLVDRVLRKFSSHVDTSSSEVFSLLSNSQRAVLLFCGAVLAFSELGYDVSALVAGLGLTGFALGFALKDAISNLIAGVMIVICQSIELSNMIQIKGTKGVVVNINLRYVTLQVEGSVHLVPNSLFLSHELVVFEQIS